VPDDSNRRLYANIGAALERQAQAMARFQHSLSRIADHTEDIVRRLDDCDLRLQGASRRLTVAADLMDELQTAGPRSALDSAIESLEQDRLDRPNTRFAAQYERMLERALAVRSELDES
jgi:predicted  nucleic acid-binding Zn-ribbon protein